MLNAPPADPSPSPVPDPGPRKRRGAQALQACDRCRTKKVKCIPYNDVCEACLDARTACTFDMPLSTSRSKRVRRGLGLAPGETLAGASGSGSPTVGPGPGWVPGQSRAPIHLQTGSQGTSTGHETRSESGWSDGRSSLSASPAPWSRAKASPGVRSRPGSRLEAGADLGPSYHKEGPTALSYILHSMPSLPLSALAEYDAGGYSMGSGWMDVRTPQPDIALAVLNGAEEAEDREEIDRLVEQYWVDATLPIITPADLEGGDPGVGRLKRAMAAVAARGTSAFDRLREAVERDVADGDITTIPTLANIQTLLLLTLVDELGHTHRPASPVQVVRTRLASALFLARELALPTNGRVWRCLRVLDIWHAARIGAAPLVSAAEDGGGSDAVEPGQGLSGEPAATLDSSAEETSPYFDNLVNLSLIVALLLERVYGPSGLRFTSSAAMLEVRDKLGAWRDGLPSELVAGDRWAAREAGILHTLYTAARFLLYRPVMRWSFIVPARFELNTDVPAWLHLTALSRVALEWAAASGAPPTGPADSSQGREGAVPAAGGNGIPVPGGTLASIVVYALGVASCVQYHTWARRGEWEGAVALERLVRSAERWRTDGPLMKRALSALSTLHAATRRPPENAFGGPRGLHPTLGVANVLAESVCAGITFVRDASAPGGGVYVATAKAAREVVDLPPGTIVLGGS